MQHELQHRAGDLVFIDDKYPTLVDRFGGFHANLHLVLVLIARCN
jgi:hypothetical protein